MPSYGIKICGVRNVKDALAAANAGATHIGFLVGQEYDFISSEQAAEIASALPSFVQSTLVTHKQDLDTILGLISEIKPRTLQLHGNVTPQQILIIKEHFSNIRLLKSFHITPTQNLNDASPFASYVHGFVLDTLDPVTQQIGGTGKTHDWNISSVFVQKFPNHRVFLAGGLTPENVAQAIQTVQPFGVDVNSSTKAPDGNKDIQRVLSFIQNAQTAFQLLSNQSVQL